MITEACPSVERIVTEGDQRPLTLTCDHPSRGLMPELPLIECFGWLRRGTCQYFMFPCRSNQPNSCGRRRCTGIHGDIDE
jgi:hypothetical protein